MSLESPFIKVLNDLFTVAKIASEKLDGSRRKTVDRCASAGKIFCDLDLWTSDLWNSISPDYV